MSGTVDVVSGVPDIPKLCTAGAEWLFCVLYVVLCRRRAPTPAERWVLAAGLAALAAVQVTIGAVPVALWLPGMGVAVAIMFLVLQRCCGTSATTTTLLLAKAFLLAELTASLEWQLYFYMSTSLGSITSLGLQLGFVVVVYSAATALVLALEWPQDVVHLGITAKELRTPAAIAVATFALSNLSYVSPTTPFSSQVGTEVFNIRTLVGAGGVALLYAYQNQLFEGRAKAEVDAIRGILRTQYAQYQQSKESIAIINHKHHDLKHQLAVLRGASSPAQRERYLDEIEQGIRDYEVRFETGNAVLDTVLTTKGLACVRRGIELTCVADGSLLGTVTEMDICTIFGNALDNAIEHAETISDSAKRLVHVSVSQFNGFVLVRVENYTEGTPVLRFHDGLPVTTKADHAYHGFGLKSVRHVATKYGGSVSVQVTEGWFELTVMLGA
ncbi:MAG TPA: GHKL domain-containing protein [Cellulomonas sp.]